MEPAPQVGSESVLRPTLQQIIILSIGFHESILKVKYPCNGYISRRYSRMDIVFLKFRHAGAYQETMFSSSQPKAGESKTAGHGGFKWSGRWVFWWSYVENCGEATSMVDQWRCPPQRLIYWNNDKHLWCRSQCWQTLVTEREVWPWSMYGSISGLNRITDT